jgi:hypothetical protein
LQEVTHGGTLTSTVTFRDCVKAVSRHAFHASPYPVILTIENHVKQQQVLYAGLQSVGQSASKAASQPAGQFSVGLSEALCGVCGLLTALHVYACVCFAYCVACVCVFPPAKTK